MPLTASFRLLLPHFRPVFTKPAFRLFVLILTGWALSSRHRFITECLFTAGQVGIGHGSCYHRFFSHCSWSLDDLCRVLAGLLLRRFAPDGTVLLAADDTLCRKRGQGVFGAAPGPDRREKRPVKSPNYPNRVGWRAARPSKEICETRT